MPTTIHYIRQGDRLPALEWSFERNGVPINFTTYTGLTFCAKHTDGVTTISGGVTTGTSGGVLKYEFDAGDTATLGTYRGIFTGLDATSKPDSFPTRGVIVIVVQAKPC